MGKTLIVAEKPSVGRDIARTLGVKGRGEGAIEGDKYIVTWAVGHLVALCEPDEVNPEWKRWSAAALPMLPDTIPTKVLPKTKSQFTVIKKLMNSPEVERIVCATDSGREGELIFRLIYQKAGCKKPCDRLWISSMTDEAIRAGFASLKPAREYDALYISAKCRSEADWLVGMNATRAYTLRYGALLSVGRVQTPTLNLIVMRDREINAFVPRDYWEIRADFGDYTGLWLDPATRETRCHDEGAAKEIASAVAGREGVVKSCEREKKRTPPPQLYDLTQLQRECNGKLGLSAADALTTAQALYEKHKLITYPRTDSRYLPPDMIPSVKKALASLPVEYAVLAAPLIEKLPVTGRVYNGAKVTDHHAIIPTGRALGGNLTPRERGVYDLVVRRLIAAHYPDYHYESTRVITGVDAHDFLTTGTATISEGWRAVYRDSPSQGEDAPLPRLKEGDVRKVVDAAAEKKKTKPPDRMNDASLLKAMESAGRTVDDEELREQMKDSGLGTPATRAAIIERLIEVGYVKRAGKAIVSTEKGDKLISVTPDEIKSPETTGRWEKALTNMARAGEYARAAEAGDRFIKSIHRYAAFLVEAAAKSGDEVVFEREQPGGKRRTSARMDVKCPACGEGYLLENSRAFGCSEWKKGCGFTIWKDALKSRSGPQITRSMIEKLMSGKTVNTKYGAVSYVDGRIGFNPKNEKKQ